MKIIKMSDAEAKAATGNLFVGEVSRRTLINAELSNEFMASLITFSPGAKNVFHTHTNEQVLYITEGKGIVATEKEEHIVTPGMIVFIPSGELHWHGATKDSSFSHISFTVPGLKTIF